MAILTNQDHIIGFNLKEWLISIFYLRIIFCKTSSGIDFDKYSRSWHRKVKIPECLFSKRFFCLNEIEFHIFLMKSLLNSIEREIFLSDICIFRWWNYWMQLNSSKKYMSFLKVELLSQKGRRMLWFGFKDIDFQTYRCLK